MSTKDNYLTEMKSQLEKKFEKLITNPELSNSLVSDLVEELRESFKRGLRLGHAQAKDKKTRFRKKTSHSRS